jgi:hypothetical protein
MDLIPHSTRAHPPKKESIEISSIALEGKFLITSNIYVYYFPEKWTVV